MTENLWVHIAYRKQDDGKIDCTLTSNVPLERGVDYYDMKVYVTGNRGRVSEQFAVAPGGTIHLDVYSNGGEGSGLINADFRVTEQAVEVVKCREIEATASPTASNMAKNFTTMTVGNTEFLFDFNIGELHLRRQDEQMQFSLEEAKALGDFLYEVLQTKGYTPRIYPITITNVK